ncbi:hypothetical protein GCK32_008519 [Trichostrongylus colubriformis]|uniref:Uncharacterized protein n=1 Tax=Trichostrongylus colubriformis TaxID=6319 RepID=A0AAN8J275_TRICO
MRVLFLVLMLTSIAIAAFDSQASGYEVAEEMQPAPAPVSANGGDQQAYNTDGKGAPPTVIVPPPSPPSAPAPAPGPVVVPAVQPEKYAEGNAVEEVEVGGNGAGGYKKTRSHRFRIRKRYRQRRLH